mmetsp:Transcript_27236/g.63473  ORF Transcript_27236/g.63473 Transcript_27236/m.63473 type:complete len:516 (-) Transcript_27236:291-1838(-)
MSYNKTPSSPSDGGSADTPSRRWGRSTFPQPGGGYAQPHSSSEMWLEGQVGQAHTNGRGVGGGSGVSPLAAGGRVAHQGMEKAISDFAAKRMPVSEDINVREQTMQRLRLLVQRALNVQSDDVALHLFGSAESGFGGRGCDLDVAVEIHCPSGKIKDQLREKKITELSPLAKGCIFAVAKEAKDAKGLQHFEVLGKIPHAKVPLVMLRDRHSQSSVDVSFGNLKGVENTKLLKAYSGLDERLFPVVMVVKKWAKCASVSGSKRGHLSSYSFTLLVIFFFQVECGLPSLQELKRHDEVFLPPEEAKRQGCYSERSDRSAAELLQQFFVFYLNDFQWDKEVVSIRLGRKETVNSGEFPDLKHKGDRNSIHIEDPLELERNLNCVLYGQESVVELRRAMDVALQNVRKGNFEALFTCQCGWCNQVILWQEGQHGEEAGGREDEYTDMWYCHKCWQDYMVNTTFAQKASAPAQERRPPVEQAVSVPSEKKPEQSAMAFLQPPPTEKKKSANKIPKASTG